MANISRNLSRREALKLAAGCCAAGVGAPFLFSLAGVGAAAAQAAGDFKALVCVFQYGGNDQSNSVIPYSGEAYEAYFNARPTLARASEELIPINPPAWSGPELALPLELGRLADLFAAGRCAILPNVGTLLEPTTQAQILAGTALLPRQLFSHSDQQGAWQTGIPDTISRTGWLGRFGDLLTSTHNPGAAVSICMSLAGNNVLQAGEDVIQYQLTNNGAVAITGLDSYYFGDEAAAHYRALISGQRSHLLENEFNRVTARSIAAEAAVTGALAGVPPLTTPFPQTRLGAQMGMVARMIAARAALGHGRQIFFVATGGWDFHDNLVADQSDRLQELGDGLGALYDATVELGVAANVTSFTASDFGRALQFNGRGSDHGWGGHHFIVGGAVRGGRVFGSWPTVALGGPEDVGQGRLIPTTAVDEYAAELALWFGVPPAALATAIPYINRFPRVNVDFLV